MGGRYKRRGLRKQCNEEGYTEKRMRVVKEKEERERERENNGARAQKESENTDYCAKRIRYHVCVFRRGFVRSATRPPGSQKERDGGRKERERERGEKGEGSGVYVNSYRTALACFNERKSICMIHARESVLKRVGEGQTGRSC